MTEVVSNTFSMADHANFWLITGAAGPVLLLAQILNTAVGASFRLGPKERNGTKLLVAVSYFGFGTSCYVLFDSLAVMGDLVSADSRVRRWITVVMIFVSAVCLLASSAGVLELQRPAEEDPGGGLGEPED